MPSHVVRVQCEARSQSRTVRDAATGEVPFLWRGSSVVFQLGLSDNGAFLLSTAIGQVIVEVKALNATSADDCLMRKVFEAADCDGTFAGADWAGGSKHLLAANFTLEEAAILAGTYRLIVRHVAPDETEMTFLSTEFRVLDPQSGSEGIEAPPVAWSYLEALPVIRPDIVQTLTSGQKQQARENIGIESDSAATARLLNLAGRKSLASIPKKLHKWVKRENSKEAFAGVAFSGRQRIGIHGDSMTIASNVGPLLAQHLGFGGKDYTGGFGVTGGVISEDFPYTPRGIVRSATSGSHELYYPVDTACQSLYIGYHASSSGGSFKVQYQVNKTGSYVDHTEAAGNGGAHEIEVIPLIPLYFPAGTPTVYSPKPWLEAGMTVAGTGIPGATTILSVQTSNLTKSCNTASTSTITVPDTTGLALYMVVAGAGIPVGSYITGINVAGNTVTISQAATATAAGVSLTFTGRTLTLSANTTAGNSGSYTVTRNDAGSSSAGIISTNNGGAKKYSTVRVNLPGFDFYNIKIIPTSGTVAITDVWANGGGFNSGRNGYASRGGLFWCDQGAGGKNLASHFTATTQDTWNRFMARLDPDLWVFKTVNDVSVSYLETHFPTYIGRIKAAAPEATIIVCGNMPSHARPSRDDANNVAIDNWWKEYCAANDIGFLDLLSAGADYEVGETVNDFWPVGDGLHPYVAGDVWTAAVLWDYLAPALAATGPFAQKLQPFKQFRPLPHYTEMPMYGDPAGAAMGPHDNQFHLVAKPRTKAGLMIRGNTAFWNAGTQTWDTGLTGFTADASDASSPMALSWYSDNFPVLKVGHHSSLRRPLGMLFGAVVGEGSQARMTNGIRIIAPENTYGAKDGVVVETRGGQTLRCFGINLNATDTSEGVPLWSWMPDGSVVFEGTSDDANEITFTYENPAADVTIHTPAVAGTVGIAPAFADGAAASAGGVAVGECWWDTTTKKLKTRMS